MKSLLVVAHGSRRQQSNDEVRSITARLRERDSQFEQIDCAFLELAEPAIPDGLRQLIQSGSRQIVVLPYFLSAGRHVTIDLPREVAIVASESPEVAIHLVDYLGAAQGVEELMLSQAVITESVGE
ncbi:MAG: CbiX/SirB N-terminal domain-containing protein [Gammaproteobacteria bacterium]